MAITEAMLAVLGTAPILVEVDELASRDEASIDASPMSWHIHSEDVATVEICRRYGYLIYVSDDDATGWTGRGRLVLTDQGRSALAAA